jgi:hypothetical protein
MSDWTLTLGLQNLRSQVNAVFPDRDKLSDGSIGDTLHRLHTSGHNPDDTSGSKPAWDGDPDSTPEVRSWDMDSDLRAPGADAQDVVDHIRRLPGVSSVLRYMIYNHWEYHSRNGFAPTPYSGPSPHEEHIHFEGAWTQASDNNISFNYRLEEIPVALTAADKTWISKEIADRVAAAVPRYTVAITGSVTEELPEAIFNFFRQQQKSPYSDTARNLLEARITKALVAGEAIPPYPANATAAAAK